MSEYYNGNNREEEKKVKLAKKIDDWWNSLDSNYKFELIEDYYPDKAHLMELDEMWEGLSFQDRLEMFYDDNPELAFSEEEKESIRGDMEAHEKMEE